MGCSAAAADDDDDDDEDNDDDFLAPECGCLACQDHNNIHNSSVN